LLAKHECCGISGRARFWLPLALMAAATLALTFGSLFATTSEASAQSNDGSIGVSPASTDRVGTEQRECQYDYCGTVADVYLFPDPDPGCEIEVTVDWGDGTSQEEILTDETIPLSHKYKKRNKAKVYTISATGEVISGGAQCGFTPGTLQIKVP
jgi:hypothetical protein